MYYLPEQYSTFDSITSKCSFYGNKNLHTGEIEYSYAIDCRKNETICGEQGKLYEEEKFIHNVKLRHSLSQNSLLYISFFTIVYFSSK